MQNYEERIHLMNTNFQKDIHSLSEDNNVLNN